MSDPEDEFSDDIKLLEDVLAQDRILWEPDVPKNIAICNPPSGRRTNSSYRGFGQVEPNPNEISSNEFKQRDSAYEMNKKLIELLRETRQELTVILERCILNKRTIEEKIRNRGNAGKSQRVLICTAGMPYFKDEKHYPAPWNADVRKKMRNGELQVVHLRYPCSWTAKDRNILWRAIRQEAASQVLESQQVVVSQNDEDYVAQRSRVTEALNLPKNFKAMVGPLDAREFDWLKIAAMDFDEKHTADECRVMWRVFLHPDVNRYRWTKDEDSKIDILSKKYEQQDWDAIARELNTQRSGYQCFIRYNSVNRTICLNDNQWETWEDERLRTCVNKFKIGHYIPWGTVGRYMRGRSKNQVYYRWTYNAAPHLKKGRFTEEEDLQFIEAIRKYGKNFCKISNHAMPNRSSVQLSDHYHTLVLRENGQHSWNINEDARLLALYDKYGADWSTIARKIPGKTRTQARHRHNSILRYFTKGLSLYEIPRDYTRNLSSDDDRFKDSKLIELLENERLEREKEKEKERAANVSQMNPIDRELIRYFQLIPEPAKPGRKRKYYQEDELEDTTRKLCIILKTLGAKLVIPADLDDQSLTEKDKQLLKSLEDYRNSRLDTEGCPKRAFQYGGTNDDETDDDNRQKHFTPLCSGDCNINEKKRWHNIIDYEPPKSIDHCNMRLVMKIDTPKEIVNLVGDEKNYQFDKLIKILRLRKMETCETKIVKKIYVLGPKVLSTIGVENLPTESTSCEIESTNKESGNKNKNVSKRNKVWSSTIVDGIIRNLERPVDYIAPNYHTLQGLRHIILTDNSSVIPNLHDPPLVKSDQSKRSMELLKKRLTQFFKYPIGLSHILRPEIHVHRNLDDSTNVVNNEASASKNIADDGTKTTEPASKKKRL